MTKNHSPKKSLLSNGLGIAIILIQLVDIIIHVATDQAEPIRITSNIIIMSWNVALGMNWLGKQARPISFATIGTYLILNLIFLSQNGLTNPEQGGTVRMALFLLVFLTVVLSALLTLRMSTSSD